MTTALAHRAPARLPYVPQPSRYELLDLLADAREELADADEALALALLAVRLVAKHSAAPVLGNPRAEARVLGALLLGRATLADVADLDPGSFTSRLYQELFLAALIVSEHLGSMPSGQPRRERSERLIRRMMRTVPRPQRRQCPDVADALEALPWPATCPVDAIVRVRELARERRGL